MNPLLTYFGKYEGQSNYLYTAKGSESHDSDEEEEIDESFF